MRDPLAVRTIIGLGPVLLACVLAAWRRPQRSEAAALVLAIAWVAAWIFPVALLGLRLGWWELRAEGGMFQGIPVDLWVGRAIGCGALPLILAPRATYRFAVFLSAVVGAALVAADGAVIHFGPGWPVGALVEFGACVLPAQLIGCWTRDRTHVYGRVVLQLIEFTALYLIVVTALLVQTGGSWARVLEYSPLVNVPVIVLLAIPLLSFGWGGILEFPARGLGTPLPYDTAPRLLTSGPYAYIRNPVQLSVALLLAGVGAWLSSPIVFVVGILSVPISQVLSDWDEIHEMPRRYGDEFRAYRRNVRRWLPSWYPWCPRTARLYVGTGGLADLARYIARRGVRGLEVVESNSAVTLRYDPRDGLPEETDVVALARVMEHRNLAWALLGVFMRLPPVRALARLLTGVRASAGVRETAVTLVATTMEHPVLVFDGQCNFCNSYVNFLIDRDRRNRFRFAHAQSTAGLELLRRHGLSTDPFEGSVLVIGDQAFTKTTGWLRTMRLLGGVWLLAMVVVVIPRRIRDAAFLTFGRNRYHWFGKTDTCPTPSPERAHRFLDNGLIARLGNSGVATVLTNEEEGAR